MNTIPNPDSWQDVFTIIAVALIAAAVPSWFAHRNHRSLNDIKDQVVNGHDQPMRFDLDRAITSIDSLADDVRSLRRDLMAEEDRRRAQILDIREELEHRKHNRW